MPFPIPPFTSHGRYMTPAMLTPAQHSDIGTSLPIDFKYMANLAAGLVALCEKKNAEYGSAWKKRGGQGAFFQGIARKWDRIETQLKAVGYNMFDVTEDETSTESLDESLKDLVNYCLLALETRESIRATIQAMPLKEPSNPGVDTSSSFKVDPNRMLPQNK